MVADVLSAGDGHPIPITVLRSTLADLSRSSSSPAILVTTDAGESGRCPGPQAAR